MKRPSLIALVSGILAVAASPLLAATGSSRPTRVVTRASAADSKTPRVEQKAQAADYSVQVNIVTRVQGTSFFKTAIDITNNTDVDNVAADIQYCYTFGGSYQGCTATETLTLLSFDSFHTDDIVDYIDSLGDLPPGAGDLSFGTLLVTFHNLPSAQGWEGTVLARTYSPYDQANPSAGTVAIAYYGSLFFESASGTLVGLVRDTQPAPTDAGALRTNLGVTNTDLNGAGAVNVEVSFYDVTPGTSTNGTRVGDILTLSGLGGGEVRQINDVFGNAHIPDNVLSCIVFVDVTSPTTGDPTIEGYVNILSAGTQDGAFFEMKCTVGCAF